MIKLKYISTFSIVVAFLILTSCTRILLVMYGVHKPKAENSKSLTAFLDKHKMNFAENFVTDTLGFKILTKYGAPEIMVFDKNLNFVPYKSEAKGTCNAPAESFLSRLNAANNYETSKQYNFDTIVSHLRTFDGKKVEINSIKKNDFIIVMTWAKWMGYKIHKEHTVSWYNAIKNNKNCNMVVLMVNVDLQENWGKDVLEKYKR